MPTIDDLLTRVSKPARYTGGEWNSVTKRWDSTTVRIALAYPDAYDIGMSNMGIGILYDLLNKVEDVACERVFAPVGRHGSRDAARRRAPLEPRDALPHPRLRCRRVHAPVRDDLHERPQHARPRGHPASGRSERDGRAPDRHRRRAAARSTPSRWRRSSTPSSSAKAKTPSSNSPTSCASGNATALPASSGCASLLRLPGVYVPGVLRGSLRRRGPLRRARAVDSRGAARRSRAASSRRCRPRS